MPINPADLDAILEALMRGEASMLTVDKDVTWGDLMQAIDDRIADAEKRKADAIRKLIEHRQSKVQ